MIYNFSLQMIGIVAGILLVIIGLPGLLRPSLVQGLAKRGIAVLPEH